MSLIYIIVIHLVCYILRKNMHLLKCSNGLWCHDHSNQ